MSLRPCKYCGVTQPFDRFPRAKSTSPGMYHEHRCKACYARCARKRYQSDPTHQARQIACSMNHAVARRTRGRVTEQVDVETLAALILSAQACAYCQGLLDTFGSLGNRAKGDLLLGESQAWLTGIARGFPQT